MNGLLELFYDEALLISRNHKSSGGTLPSKGIWGICLQRYIKLLVGVVMISLLAGCLGGASISIKVSPDPVVFEFGDTSRDITLTFRTHGFGTLKLDKFVVQLFDDEDTAVWTYEAKLDTERFSIPGITVTEEITVELPNELIYASKDLYDSELKGSVYTLVITVTGGKNITKEVEVMFE